MTNLSGIPPRQKEPRAEDDPEYLARVRECPCVICEAFGELQLSPTEAHHPIHRRRSQRKRPDNTAIPLCDGHHQGLFDRSKIALHREPKRWKAVYGEDVDYIEVTRDKLGWTGC